MQESPRGGSRRYAGQLPRIVVVGTGGTIAGSGAAAAGRRYRAAVTGVEELLTAVPDAVRLARLSCVQLLQVDSVDLDLERRMAVARAVDDLVARPRESEGAVDGVVVTHGTDTLEETAVLLHLAVRTGTPVVVVGAMRPADAVSADGPANLLDAIRVAADPTSRDRGALVVLNEQILAARDVHKADTTRADAFESPYGPLGRTSVAGVHWARRLEGRHGADASFDLRVLPADRSLPRVEAVIAHPDLAEAVFEAAVSQAAGIVLVATGDGNIPQRLRPWIRRARARGVAVARAARVTGGYVTRNAAVNDDELGTVACGDFDAAKARVLLALALTRTSEPAGIQELFDRS